MIYTVGNSEKNKKNADQIKHVICDWINWLNTRKFFAPPIPKNILAQMIRRKDGEILKSAPDAELSAFLAAWNLVIKDAKENDFEHYICFIYVYLPRYRPKPVKCLAADLNIDTDSVYSRAHKRAVLYYNQAIKLEELSKLMNKEVAGFTYAKDVSDNELAA